ncbi:hypothetical protein tb265_13670 [Gemmatimonadetes bacterium T265]|nr:hypothetical protein tb265_13670 [Gemmatimonadetes bacterium T265]
MKRRRGAARHDADGDARGGRPQCGGVDLRGDVGVHEAGDRRAAERGEPFDQPDELWTPADGDERLGRRNTVGGEARTLAAGEEEAVEDGAVHVETVPHRTKGGFALARG